jgi:hypothetical protein
MKPEVVVCSVGKSPSTDASAKYEAHRAEVISTRTFGSILVRIWESGKVRITGDNNYQIHVMPRLTDSWKSLW